MEDIQNFLFQIMSQKEWTTIFISFVFLTAVKKDVMGRYTTMRFVDELVTIIIAAFAFIVFKIPLAIDSYTFAYLIIVLLVIFGVEPKNIKDAVVNLRDEKNTKKSLFKK
ncbi:MAG: hypothetical protein ACI35O_08045 [Bacillaceae bacterium]